MRKLVQVAMILLQNDSCYKIRRLLQIATVQTVKQNI